VITVITSLRSLGGTGKKGVDAEIAAQFNLDSVNGLMFKRTTMAYDASSESGRALASGVRMAQAHGSELHAVTTCEPSTVSTVLLGRWLPPLAQKLAGDQIDRTEQRVARARELTGKHGIEIATHIVEGSEGEAIVSGINNCKTDLLVFRLDQEPLYVSRVWSTLYRGALGSTL
jgi:hypothetical protein